MLFAWYRQRQNKFLYEKLLLLGFAFGFFREPFMMIMVSLQAYNVISADYLHIIFPPLEHAIFDIAMIEVG